MVRQRALQLILVVFALWNLFFGVYTAFLEGAPRLLGVGVTDPIVARSFGVKLVVLAVTYLLVARDPVRNFAFLWVPIAEAAVALAFGILDMVTTSLTFADFGPYLLFYVVILVLLLLAYPWVRAGAKPGGEKAGAPDPGSKAQGQ